MTTAEKIIEQVLKFLIVLVIIFSAMVVYESKKHGDRIAAQEIKCVEDMFGRGC